MLVIILKDGVVGEGRFERFINMPLTPQVIGFHSPSIVKENDEVSTTEPTEGSSVLTTNGVVCTINDGHSTVEIVDLSGPEAATVTMGVQQIALFSSIVAIVSLFATYCTFDGSHDDLLMV